jgi:hypothetical protein
MHSIATVLLTNAVLAIALAAPKLLTDSNTLTIGEVFKTMEQG